jgi:hypothetical protein
VENGVYSISSLEDQYHLNRHIHTATHLQMLTTLIRAATRPEDETVFADAEGDADSDFTPVHLPSLQRMERNSWLLY